MEDLKMVAIVVGSIIALLGGIAALCFWGYSLRLDCIDKVKHLPAAEIVMVCGK